MGSQKPRGVASFFAAAAFLGLLLGDQPATYDVYDHEYLSGALELGDSISHEVAVELTFDEPYSLFAVGDLEFVFWVDSLGGGDGDLDSATDDTGDHPAGLSLFVFEAGNKVLSTTMYEEGRHSVSLAVEYGSGPKPEERDSVYCDYLDECTYSFEAVASQGAVFDVSVGASASGYGARGCSDSGASISLEVR